MNEKKRHSELVSESPIEIVKLGDAISKSKVERNGNQKYPVLSMTMRDGLIFQENRFSKQIASIDQSNYLVVKRNQLVESFPIDEGVLDINRICEKGIVSPAYKLWDIDEDLVIPEFLVLFLKSEKSISFYKQKLRGTTARRRSITDEDFLGMEIPLYSKKKQNEIVDLSKKAKLLINQHKKLLELHETLIKSQFVKMFGDPVTNPMGWEVKPLEKVAPAKQAEKIDDEKVWLLNLDMVESQTGRILDYLITDSKKVGNSTYYFDENNVLYSKLRPYLNKVVVPEKKGICTSELVPLRPIAILNRYFLANLLRSKSFVSFINEKTEGAKMPRVSMKIFREFNCILPPLALQQKFATFVLQVEKSKQNVQASLQKAETLYKALMQKYFG